MRYAIPDEPRQGGLSHAVVNPIWPLFAQMLGGSWLAIPWFLFNGEALGSSMRKREWLCAIASVGGSALIALAIGWAAGAGYLDRTGIRFGLLAIVALKLSTAYLLYSLQAQTFEIWQHFGGKEKAGWVLVLLGLYFRANLERLLAEQALLLLVLS
jgi:hypothetical protein